MTGLAVTSELNDVSLDNKKKIKMDLFGRRGPKPPRRVVAGCPVPLSTSELRRWHRGLYAYRERETVGTALCTGLALAYPVLHSTLDSPVLFFSHLKSTECIPLEDGGHICWMHILSLVVALFLTWHRSSLNVCRMHGKWSKEMSKIDCITSSCLTVCLKILALTWIILCAIPSPRTQL